METDTTIIEARIAAALASLDLIQTFNPDLCDNLALIRSDLEIIRGVLAWRKQAAEALA